MLVPSGPFNWVCPHCEHAQTVVTDSVDHNVRHLPLSGLAEGSVSVIQRAIGCANPECRHLTLSIWLQKDFWSPDGYHLNAKEKRFGFVRVLPRGAAKPQPDYIPEPLREDYAEACAIRDLSPKAAATLIRRCLQGMIRDFCGISDGTLSKEIIALRTAVHEGRAPPDVSRASVDAIDGVRQIGQFGAHMEKDINLIVDVQPDEAQTLIELAETLFQDWYVARHQREERFASINELAAAKKKLQTNLTARISDGEPVTRAPADGLSEAELRLGIAAGSIKPR